MFEREPLEALQLESKSTKCRDFHTKYVTPGVAQPGLQAEWDARCQLANGYRIIAKFGEQDFG